MIYKKEDKILHLTLLRKWFDSIALGQKLSEYRAIKPYWKKRLIKENKFILFKEIHFKNGYNKIAPFMRVEHLGTKYCMYENKKVYEILLGKVLEIKNWEKK